MRRLIGAALATVLGAVVAFATPLTVSAALLWTLTVSPLAVGTGTPTAFTLTAANILLGRIECVVVDVPANFSVGAVGVVGSTAGDSWVAASTGNQVTVRTPSGGDRLEVLDTVTFIVNATPMSVGSLAWTANAYSGYDCNGSGSLLGVPPVVVVTGPAVTSSPTPSPVPTPRPTPSPTPVPTPSSTPLVPLPTVPLPTIPLPVPLPSIGLPRTPAPTPHPAASSHVSPTAPPPPSAAPEASAPGLGEVDGPSAGALPPGGGSQPPESGPAAPNVDSPGVDSASPRVAFDEPGVDLGVGSMGLLAGVQIWAVPVAIFGGPGLIVLLWVALQAGGMAAWIPSVRRLRGEAPRPAP